MIEPKRCLKCNNPIAPNQTLCHSCFTDEYLDETLDGESWEQPNLYDETWDDSEYDEIDIDSDD